MKIRTVNYWTAPFVVLLALLSIGAIVVTRVGEYPRTLDPGTNSLVLLSVPNSSGQYYPAAGATNYAIRWDALKSNIIAGVATSNTWYSLLQVTQFYTFDFYSSNVYITNIYAENIYISNSFVTNLNVSNYTVHGRQENRKASVYKYAQLSMSDTNVDQINLGSEMFYWLELTNNGYMPAPTGAPGTNLAETIQIVVRQGGGHTLDWATNWFGSATNSPTITTNANTIEVFTFLTSPLSSTELFGVNQRVR